MSRVGRKPIPLPKGVKVTIGGELLVEGPKGKLAYKLPEGITVKMVDKEVHVNPADEERRSNDNKRHDDTTQRGENPFHDKNSER